MESHSRLVKLLPNIFSDNKRNPISHQIKNHLFPIVGFLYPEAVMDFKTGFHLTPSHVNDRLVLYLSDGKTKRKISIGDIDLVFDGNIGAIEGDIGYLGAFRASEARLLLNNYANYEKCIGVQFVEDYLVKKILMKNSDIYFNCLLQDMDKIKNLLNKEKEFYKISKVILAIKDKNSHKFKSKISQFYLLGKAYDVDHINDLKNMKTTLDKIAMPENTERFQQNELREPICFFESYFSNYIEGVRFSVKEAQEIVEKEEAVFANRIKDSHDIIRNYEQSLNYQNDEKISFDYNIFIEELKRRHAHLMEKRPEVNPGEFKTYRNMAGNTVFVDPQLVNGSLEAGLDIIKEPGNHPFAKALMIHYLLSFVHPFDDGNGRISRIFMNKILVDNNLSRIIGPNVHRDDYILTLKLISEKFSRDNSQNSEAFFRCMNFLQKFTSNLIKQEMGFDELHKELELLNTFKESTSGERLKTRVIKYEITKEPQKTPEENIVRFLR